MEKSNIFDVLTFCKLCARSKGLFIQKATTSANATFALDCVKPLCLKSLKPKATRNAGGYRFVRKAAVIASEVPLFSCSSGQMTRETLAANIRAEIHNGRVRFLNKETLTLLHIQLINKLKLLFFTRKRD